MPESNQEGYRSLGWIINKSEQGLFLATDDSVIEGEWKSEEMKQKIAEAYDLIEQAKYERNNAH